jgi:excisionase family DNA binding protein
MVVTSRVHGVDDERMMINQTNTSNLATFLRPSRVAEILDISRTSVYDLIKTGELTGIIRVGSRLRIPQQAVEELVHRRVVG